MADSSPEWPAGECGDLPERLAREWMEQAGEIIALRAAQGYAEAALVATGDIVALPRIREARGSANNAEPVLAVLRAANHFLDAELSITDIDDPPLTVSLHLVALASAYAKLPQAVRDAVRGKTS